MDAYKIDVTEMSEQDKVRVQEAAFKLGYYWGTSIDNVINLQAGYYYLGRNGILGWDWASSGDSFNKECCRQITLQQLLKLAGMQEENMSFTKADLVAGKHVVELVDGSRYTLVNLLDKVVGFNLQAEHKGFHDTWYESLREDMTYPYNKNHTVVAVYEMVKLDVYWSCSDCSLDLIWKRSEKSASQIELEKLQQQIAELTIQANKLQQTL